MFGNQGAFNTTPGGNQVGQAMGGQQNDSSQDLNIQNQQQWPTDSVACMAWMPNNQQKILAAGCWDGKLKIYMVEQQGLNQQMELNINETIQDIAWKNDGTMLFVAAGNTLKRVFMQNQQVQDMGQHQAGISNVFWSENNQVLITTGFDMKINLWQAQSQGQPVKTHQLQNKIYCASIKDDFLVMGLSGEKIMIEKISNLMNGQANPQNMFDSSHLGPGSQINASCVTTNANKYMFGVASIDGRANMSYFTQKSGGVGWDTNSVMTFKCHKEEKDGKQIMHPVNAMGFNCRNENFVFTAGSEGKMYFWDIQAKNKVKTFNLGGLPVTAAAMSPDGQCIAYALGYDWHGGFEKFNQYKTYQICVHIIPDKETRYQKGANY